MILKLTSIALLLSATPLPASANWGTQPLGSEVKRSPDDPKPVIKHQLKSHYHSQSAKAQATLFFQDGEPQCALILPANPTGVETNAANLLQVTLQKMTGGKFFIYPESAIQSESNGEGVSKDGKRWKHLVWIGRTERAKAEQLSANDLKPEGFRREKRASGLFIVGHDSGKQGKILNGTYYAVADLLERHFGIRWLWPDELGAAIPKVTRLSLPALKETDEPALAQRIIRNGAVGPRAAVGLRLLNAREGDYAAVLRRNAQWLLNQKTGTSIELNYKHAFGHWYESYGAQHPEWFAMQANGSREQFSDRPRICKSNREAALQKAREVINQYKKNPELDSAAISPNDGGGRDYFCMCEGCRKLDPPNANPIRVGYWKDGKREVIPSYPALSDRFVTFYNRIAEAVVKELPDARLGAYAYSSYRDVPLGVSVHPAIMIGFVGLDYTNESLRSEDLKRWDGWSCKAHDIILRPNALHGGQALPLVYTERLASDVKHCYQTGMMAADFDSLNGHWSTQGLNYYVLAKLLWDPSLDVKAVVADYCRAGFGKAAPQIAEYFALMEKASAEMAGAGRARVEGELREEEDNEAPLADRRTVERDAFERAYFAAFSQEVMQTLRQKLETATRQAGDDPMIKARIAFLSAGLDYSDHCRQIIDSKSSKEAKEELLNWYRKMFKENPHILNAPTRLWRTSRLFRGLE